MLIMPVDFLHLNEEHTLNLRSFLFRLKYVAKIDIAKTTNIKG